MADLKEVLIKGNWAAEINRYQNELLNMAARIDAIRTGISNLKTTISGSELSSVADNALITGAHNFINSANVSNFETAVNSNLPILS